MGRTVCKAVRDKLELSRPLNDIFSYSLKDLELLHAYLNGLVNLLSLLTFPVSFL